MAHTLSGLAETGRSGSNDVGRTPVGPIVGHCFHGFDALDARTWTRQCKRSAAPLDRPVWTQRSGRRDLGVYWRVRGCWSSALSCWSSKYVQMPSTNEFWFSFWYFRDSKRLRLNIDHLRLVWEISKYLWQQANLMTCNII